jgi:zinc transport system substrate-binding protein
MTCLLVLILLAATGCNSEPAQPTGKIRVFVSIPPQVFFAERIGGEHVEVEVLVGQGQSPHSYEPTPKQIAGLVNARIYFSIDMPFEERLVEKIRQSHENLEIVNTSQGIWLIKNEEHPEGSETGEHEHKHADDEIDPHVWMSPQNAKIIAGNMCNALKELDPGRSEQYSKNLSRLEKELDNLDRSIASVLKPLKGKEFYVFHPAFGYFARAYGLKQVAVETGGKEPSARQLAELIEKAKKAGVKVIFVQPQFSRSSAEAVAKEIGGAVVPIDSLARDYVQNLNELSQQIFHQLEKTMPPPEDWRKRRVK